MHQNYIVFQWSFDAQLMTSTVVIHVESMCNKAFIYSHLAALIEAASWGNLEKLKIVDSQFQTKVFSHHITHYL